jgi:hypothetical protein
MAITTNSKRMKVSELDFDTIKTNLKTFLQSQSEFSDYDFEGSGLSVLIDLLAYNTHYNGVYTNLAVNEMFLDSASKRASVVSLSKMLGYTPRSAVCARAIVNVSITAPTSSPTVATLPAQQPFLTSIDGVSYVFYNLEDVTVARSTSGSYTFSNLSIVEGTPLSFKYTVASGVRYIIPNANIDISTLSIQIQQSSTSDIYETYTRAEDLTSVTETTKVYFLKEIDDGLYEITFGDGVLGTALSNGNVVTINYFVSSLEAPNSANIFTYNGLSVLGSNLSVTTVSAAINGSASEDLASIKFNAPRLFAAQNRAVTPDDYKALIYSQFPAAQTVSVWGGEDNNPPVYGKTFICVKPKDASKLTNQQKELIATEILNPRSVVSITPEIVDPEYFNIKVTSFVHYNPKETSKSATQIESIVKTAILDYDLNELQKFDGVLRYTKLTGIIDQADPSIINNITRLMVRHPHTPQYGVNAQYVLNLINPISQDGGKQGEVFASTGFYVPGSTKVHYLDDDAAGNIRLYYLNTNLDKVFVNRTQGTIDYEKGLIQVNGLNITSLDGAYFEWQVKPESYDIVSALNQIVQIDPTLLSVTAIADNTANGDLGAGYNYQFNSIRS